MSPLHKCPFCSSCDSHLVSSFYSAVLNAQTTTYQCQHCLALFDFPYRLAEIDSEEKKELVTIYAYDCLMNRVPVDSYYGSPSKSKSPDFEFDSLTSFQTVSDSNDNLTPLLLNLFFTVFQIIFWAWLLCLSFKS